MAQPKDLISCLEGLANAHLDVLLPRTKDVDIATLIPEVSRVPARRNLFFGTTPYPMPSPRLTQT